MKTRSPAASPRKVRIGPEKKAFALQILERLRVAVPEPRCELDCAEPWGLLVATILSAQTTDKLVNMVTPELLARWPTPRTLADAPLEAIESVIHSTGFFHSKAKALCGAARGVVERFGGEVPRTMEELISLPGVARKTGNVVLGTGFGLAEGFVVDTHVGRVARRLGFTRHEAPEKVEEVMMALVPQTEWIEAGHRFVLHGRYVCLAKAPRCAGCPLNELCPSATLEPKGTVAERAAREAEAVRTRALMRE